MRPLGHAWRGWILGPEDRPLDPMPLSAEELLAAAVTMLWGLLFLLEPWSGCLAACRLPR